MQEQLEWFLEFVASRVKLQGWGEGFGCPIIDCCFGFLLTMSDLCWWRKRDLAELCNRQCEVLAALHNEKEVVQLVPPAAALQAGQLLAGGQPACAAALCGERVCTASAA